LVRAEKPDGVTMRPNPLKRAIATANGKVPERFSDWPEDQRLYEFSEENFTLCPQV